MTWNGHVADRFHESIVYVDAVAFVIGLVAILLATRRRRDAAGRNEEQ